MDRRTWGSSGSVAELLAISLWESPTAFLLILLNEGFAPLHHQDQKHFLRLHIDAEGALSQPGSCAVAVGATSRKGGRSCRSTARAAATAEDTGWATWSKATPVGGEAFGLASSSISRPRLD